ncbi:MULTISPECIES: NAD-dependent epimerase/dehydratase family protein [unclassified Streptomyces]|uniref:NAD-dependent epimerase/dehydratase family protein n=1 Tax=unclassified Streptomyces TaxID=2593676 RepID=UPI0003748B6E|nr:MULTISPECIES: NAD-dependent epimerase/dehydratase family protein [unclassified Streptomyces]MYX38790.1 NAD-dependent epimerase/dehydratase family protein [Streptomyces sp. SID8377]
MKVFLTGGSGYIGRATIEALVRRGIQVVALARSEESARVVRDLGAAPVQGGLTDTDVLRAAARAADGVIHMGQHYGPDTAEVDRAASEALQDGAGARPYVHTGGVWVYGDTDGVADEDAPLSPPRITAWRLENEKRVLARAGTGERPVVIMPGLVHGRSGGLVETFYAAPGRETGSVPCVGDGANHWSTVHVDDVAELYVLALNAAPGSVYAGVGDLYPTQAEIAHAVSRAIGRPGAVRHLTKAEAEERMGPIAEAFALDQRLTGARARRELGWRPTRSDLPADLARP